MIGINQIIDEINRRLVERFPDFTVYVEHVPQDFVRPSFFIRFVQIGAQERIAYDVIRQTPQFTITYYAETDAYYRTDKTGMHGVLNAILLLFRHGNIIVGDRSLNIQATAGGENGQEITIDLQLDYTDDMQEPAGTDDRMQEINILINRRS